MNKQALIMVVEDQALLAEDIVNRLVTFGYGLPAGPFKSGEEALVFAKTSAPDIAILDIHLKGKMDGIELAKKLNQIKPIPVIFLTSNQDSEAFDNSVKTGAVGYINKPFTNNELKMALHNALVQCSSDLQAPPPLHTKGEIELLNDRIFIRNSGSKVVIMLDDILWIKSSGGEISAIVTHNYPGVGTKSLTAGHPLMRLEERLSFCPWLVRCSRYYMVNLKKVERIRDITAAHPGKAMLVAGEEIPLGEKYHKTVMEKLTVL